MKQSIPQKTRLWLYLYTGMMVLLILLDVLLAVQLLRGKASPFYGYLSLASGIVMAGINMALLLVVIRIMERPQDSSLYRHLEEYYNAKAEEINSALESGETADAQSMELATVIRNYARRVNELDLLKKQAENDALQSQINPHFLYNTLDTIRGQALEDGSEETAEMIECLSHIFRYSIDQKRSLLTFEDELQNVSDYLKIQQYRFENRFTVKYEVDYADLALMDARIPKLTLQPLVENAIKHGLEGYVNGGLITIRAYTTERFLYIEVEDNGVGMPAETVKKLNASLAADRAEAEAESYIQGGIALHNVNRRIKFHYGNEYGLTMASGEGGGTLAEICLPNGGTENEN